jgi:hypothetical protein
VQDVKQGPILHQIRQLNTLTSATFRLILWRCR